MKTFYTSLFLSFYLLIGNQHLFAQCGDYYAQNTSSVWKGNTSSVVTYSYNGLITQTNNETPGNGTNSFHVNNSGGDQRMARFDDFTTGYVINFSPAVRAWEIGLYIVDLDVFSNGSAPSTAFTFTVTGAATSTDFAITNLPLDVIMNYSPSTGVISSVGSFDNQGICLVGSGNNLVSSITLTSNGGISSGDLLGYSFFARNCITLPVKFIDFSGVENNGNINLNWKVAEEGNVKSYSIERSFDGIKFDFISSVLYNNSNTAPGKTYHYTDNSGATINRVFYYRIKENDIEERYSYSKIIAVNLSAANTNILTIYPNPVKENLFASIKNSNSESCAISIINATGYTMILNKIELVKGNNSFSFSEAGALPKGIYILKIKLTDKIITQKFIKQ